MSTADAHKHWEVAAPGWARWEQTIAKWMEPATDTMLHMAGVKPGVRVLDLACGAGSQTLRAAQAVGADGHVLASDIADTMLHYVRENARAAGLDNISTLAGAAEELDVAPKTFDSAICRLGLMLFSNPAHALVPLWRALPCLAASWLLWCLPRLPLIHSWPNQCRYCCATLAKRRRRRDNLESSRLVLPVCWSASSPKPDSPA